MPLYWTLDSESLPHQTLIFIFIWWHWRFAHESTTILRTLKSVSSQTCSPVTFTVTSPPTPYLIYRAVCNLQRLIHVKAQVYFSWELVLVENPHSERESMQTPHSWGITLELCVWNSCVAIVWAYICLIKDLLGGAIVLRLKTMLYLGFLKIISTLHYTPNVATTCQQLDGIILNIPILDSDCSEKYLKSVLWLIGLWTV